MRRPSLDAKALAMLWRRPHEVAAHLLWKLWRDECPQRAASLAYTTLLSLVPFLAVALAVLKGFGGLRPIQMRLESLVYTHLVTTSSWKAAEYIEKFIAGVHAGAIGTVSFLAFIVMAVSLLNTVAGAFNRVWGVQERRSVKDRFLTFFTLTILGPVLFGASISISVTIGKAALWMRLPIPGLGAGLAVVVPFLLTWAGFVLLYVVIPSAPLRLRPALFGSLAAAGIWEMAKVGFEMYVSSVVAYGRVYGSLSVIPIFLLWLYVSWLIALLGFEFSFFLQHPEVFRGPVPAATPRALSAAEAVRAFVAVAERFAQGGDPLTASQVAERLRLPEGPTLATLGDLERKGFLARVAAPAEAYLPRRSPAEVRVADLWQAMGGGMGAPEDDSLGRLLARAAEATTRSLGTTTVQELIQPGPGPGPGQAGGRARVDLPEPA